MSREEKYLHLSSTSRLPCLLYLSPCCSLHLQYQLPNLVSTNSKSMTEEACIVYKTGNHRTQWSKRWRWCVRKGICARLGRVCCWMLDRGRLEGRVLLCLRQVDTAWLASAPGRNFTAGLRPNSDSAFSKSKNRQKVVARTPLLNSKVSRRSRRGGGLLQNVSFSIWT